MRHYKCSIGYFVCRIGHNIDRRIPEEIIVGFICFANTGEYSGVLFESENADDLKELWKD